MKPYGELKTEMKTIQGQIIDAKKNERASAVKEFAPTAGTLKGEFAEVGEKK